MKKINVRGTVAALATGLAVAAALAVPAVAAPARERAPAIVQASTVTVVPLTGTFAVVGVGYVAMTDINDGLTVTMTAIGRPNASGAVLDSSRIFINFPDAGTLVGNLVAPDTINWSDGSIWRRVTTGPVPNVIGFTKAAATASLQSAGFLTKSVTLHVCDADVGIVFTQNPVGGSQAIHGTFVTLTFEANLPPKLCQ